MDVTARSWMRIDPAGHDLVPDAQEASGRSWTRLGIVGRGLGVALRTRKADILPHPRRSGRRAQGNHFPSSNTLNSVQLESSYHLVSVQHYPNSRPALPRKVSERSVGRDSLAKWNFHNPRIAAVVWVRGFRAPAGAIRASRRAPPRLSSARPRPHGPSRDRWTRLGQTRRDWTELARLDDTGRG